ncbi:hypothetical protein SCYAM73S_04576 [Streptomyces cyaneofuscatus]
MRAARRRQAPPTPPCRPRSALALCCSNRWTAGPSSFHGHGVTVPWSASNTWLASTARPAAHSAYARTFRSAWAAACWKNPGFAQRGGGLLQRGRDLPALPQLTGRHGPDAALRHQPLVLPDGRGQLDRGARRVGRYPGTHHVDEVEDGRARAPFLRRQMGQHLQIGLAVPAVASGGLPPDGVDLVFADTAQAGHAEQGHPGQRIRRPQLRGHMTLGHQLCRVLQVSVPQAAHQTDPGVEHQRVGVLRLPGQPGRGQVGLRFGRLPGQHGHPMAAPVPVVPCFPPGRPRRGSPPST